MGSAINSTTSNTSQPQQASDPQSTSQQVADLKQQIKAQTQGQPWAEKFLAAFDQANLSAKLSGGGAINPGTENPFNGLSPQEAQQAKDAIYNVIQNSPLAGAAWGDLYAAGINPDQAQGVGAVGAAGSGAGAGTGAYNSSAGGSTDNAGAATGSGLGAAQGGAYATGGQGSAYGAGGQGSAYGAGGQGSAYGAGGQGSAYGAGGQGSGYGAGGQGSAYDASGQGSGYDASGQGSGYDASGQSSGYGAGGQGSGYGAGGQSSAYGAGGQGSGYNAGGQGGAYTAGSGSSGNAASTGGSGNAANSANVGNAATTGAGSSGNVTYTGAGTQGAGGTSPAGAAGGTAGSAGGSAAAALTGTSAVAGSGSFSEQDLYGLIQKALVQVPGGDNGLSGPQNISKWDPSTADGKKNLDSFYNGIVTAQKQFYPEVPIDQFGKFIVAESAQESTLNPDIENGDGVIQANQSVRDDFAKYGQTITGADGSPLAVPGQATSSNPGTAVALWAWRTRSSLDHGGNGPAQWSQNVAPTQSANLGNALSVWLQGPASQPFYSNGQLNTSSDYVSRISAYFQKLGGSAADFQKLAGTALNSGGSRS